MEKNIIILAVGIAIGYFIFKKGVVKVTPVIETVNPGDKSKEIEGMQKLIENAVKLKYSEYGVYDEDTLASVKHLFNGTSALQNASGSIDKKFVKDLSKIYFNSQTI